MPYTYNLGSESPALDLYNNCRELNKYVFTIYPYRLQNMALQTVQVSRPQDTAVKQFCISAHHSTAKSFLPSWSDCRLSNPTIIVFTEAFLPPFMVILGKIISGACCIPPLSPSHHKQGCYPQGVLPASEVWPHRDKYWGLSVTQSIRPLPPV